MDSSDWISINDRLPDLKVINDFEKNSDEVLLCICGKEVVVGKLVASDYNNIGEYWKYWKSDIGEYVYRFNYVTHWQPIVLP